MDIQKLLSLLPFRSIKQRHVEALLIFQGLEADLPDGTTNTLAYHATDTNKLYLWNGTSWKSTTLS